MSDRYPLRLGPFVVVAPLAAETVPEVGLAFSRRGRRVRPCLLKQVRLAKSGSEDLQAAFQRASRLTRRLRHKNLARAFAVGRLEGRLFLAEAFRPGLLLGQIPRGAAMDVPTAAYIAREVAGALSFLHRFEGGLCHRRLAPEQVHLGFGGQVKVLESPFAGPARDGEPPFARAMRPSLRYLPPEISGGGAGDARSDLYMLGVLLWEMLSEQPPNRTGAPPTRPGAPLPDRVPAKLKELVGSLLSASPAARPVSAAAVRRALGPFAPFWLGGPAAVRRMLSERVDVGRKLRQLERWQADARALLPRSPSERNDADEPRRPALWATVRTALSRRLLLTGVLAALGLYAVLTTWRQPSPAPTPPPPETAALATPAPAPAPAPAADPPLLPSPPAALPVTVNPSRARRGSLEGSSESKARSRTLLEGAEVRFQWRDFEGAERLLRDALRELPDSPRPHYLLGLVLLARGEANRAAAAFARAIDLQPGYADAAGKLKLAQERASLK